MSKIIQVKDIKIGGGNPFVLIAGPCAIESEKLVIETASKLKEITESLDIPFIFKSSYDKANRTSIDSPRGVGLKEGLRILRKVKDELNLPIITDVHLPSQVAEVAEVADIIQIPAFLCRQTDLLEAAALSNRPLNVKKGQFLAPWDMNNIIEKIEKFGNDKILLCERGTTFGYNNLVVDMTGLVEMKKMGNPVIFDVTHSVQKPGGKGKSTGGNREYVEYLCRAGIAINIDGIFLETHPDPDNAFSDGPNMIKLGRMKNLLEEIKYIDSYIKSRGDQYDY